MSQFLNSVIRQLGRDTGKVISNAVFKDAHSTPIRMVRSQGRQQSSSNSKRPLKSEFEKALIFDRSATSKTLIRKIHALAIALEEALADYMGDDYLSVEEANAAFKMLNEFSSKAESVAKQLEIDEVANSAELIQLEKIVTQTNQGFHELLRKAAEGCIDMSEKLEGRAKEKGEFKFSRWLLLNTFYMRGFAKTGEKDIANTLLANIFLVGTQLIMFLVGLVTAPMEMKRRKDEAKVYLEAAEQEKSRSRYYTEIESSGL